MSDFHISTGSMFSSARRAVVEIQKELAICQKELSSGLRNDIGLRLGGGFTSLDQMRQAQVWHDALEGSVTVGNLRLEICQNAMTSIAASAQRFLDQLVGGKGAIADLASIGEAAKSSLSALTNGLNSSVAGVFVFAGKNSASPPLGDYLKAGSAASISMAGAFSAEFGLAPGDPGVLAITPAQMSSFLDGAFDSEFSDPKWGANWSSATTEVNDLVVGDGDVVGLGATANEGAFRKLAKAFVLVAEMASANVNENTRGTILDKAVELVSEGLRGLTALGSRVGNVQARIVALHKATEGEGEILAMRVAQIQNADPFEVGTRLRELMTQLEASYSISARMHQLSLVKFL